MDERKALSFVASVHVHE